MHDEKLCSNPNCECHTDESKKVATPFPIDLGNPYCCSKCAIRKDFVPDSPIKTTCIYCKKGATEKNPMLFRVYSPGEYWQHWSFDGKGCEENINNLDPIGVPFLENKKLIE